MSMGRRQAALNDGRDGMEPWRDHHLTLGQAFGTVTAAYTAWLGTFSSVAIYNTALSAMEVWDRYIAGPQP